MFRGVLLKVGRAHFRAASGTAYLACKGDEASLVDLGPEDIEDIYKARAAIEREAGRLVLQGDTAALAAELNAVLERMHDALENDKWQDVATADLRFQDSLSRDVLALPGSRSCARWRADRSASSC